jgi:hypothetical protein
MNKELGSKQNKTIQNKAEGAATKPSFFTGVLVGFGGGVSVLQHFFRNQIR